MTTRKSPNPLLILGLLMVGAILFIRFVVIGGTAPTPGMFDEGLTLTEAVDRANTQDMAVFAVATGASCPPCQVYKRTTLVDPAVETLVQGMVPVHIDIGVAPQDARALGVTSIPTTFVIRNGVVVDQAVGRLSATDLASMIKPHLASAADASAAADVD